MSLVAVLPPMRLLCRSCYQKQQSQLRLASSRRHKSDWTGVRQKCLPASYYRGGTSRAVMFNRDDLPPNRKQWANIFRGVIGSPDRYGRQLDGMGTGVSSLSKVCVVGPPTSEVNRRRCDVEFTFAHLDTKFEEVDYSGNCGNMLSAVGPFAWDTGIVGQDSVEFSDKGTGEVKVRILNTNTDKVIRSTFGLAEGHEEAAADGGFMIAGVDGSGARVRLDFMDPAGAKTGEMLPTRSPRDTLSHIGLYIPVSAVDVANPCVFVPADAINTNGQILPDDPLWEDMDLKSLLESLRRQGAVMMGMAEDFDAAADLRAVPKIIVVSKPTANMRTIDNYNLEKRDVDIIVRAMSMGLPHRAIPITAAICTAAACKIPGTVANEIYEAGRRKGTDAKNIRIGHPSGVVEVNATFDESGMIVSGTVYRTARRLMSGEIYWNPASSLAVDEKEDEDEEAKEMEEELKRRQREMSRKQKSEGRGKKVKPQKQDNRSKRNLPHSTRNATDAQDLEIDDDDEDDDEDDYEDDFKKWQQEKRQQEKGFSEGVNATAKEKDSDSGWKTPIGNQLRFKPTGPGAPEPEQELEKEKKEQERQIKQRQEAPVAEPKEPEPRFRMPKKQGRSWRESP